MVFLHFCLIYEPPGVHNDLVLDSVRATLVVSKVDLLVIHRDEVGGSEDAVHCVPDWFVCSARDEPMVKGFFLLRAKSAEGRGN